MALKNVLVFADDYGQFARYVLERKDRDWRTYRYVHSPEQIEGIEPGTCDYVYLGQHPGRNVIGSSTYRLLMVKEDIYAEEHRSG